MVADLPIDALVARSDELSRGWAIALIGGGSIDRLADIPLGELSREAPALCTQTLRALRSDVELDRLTGGGASNGRERSAQALGLPSMTGASDAEATVDAVEALRGVLWEALLDELHAPSPRMVADLADRLGYVCSRALAAAVATVAAPLEREAVSAQVDRGARQAAADTGSAPSDAVIVDERDDLRCSVSREPREGEAESEAPPRSLASEERPLSWDESPPVSPVSRIQPAPTTEHADKRPLSWDESPPVRPSGEREEIEIRDIRAAEGPAAWIGSIGQQLARFQDDGQPFAVLLVELLEIESLRRDEPLEELERLSQRVQDALADELRAAGSGSLTCESPGRYWLLALDTDTSRAARLAERLTRAVASSVRHRQTPLAVVLGAAVCPDDGQQAPMLAAHADVGLYAARSAARAPANS